jgi:hypothetical protein
MSILFDGLIDALLAWLLGRDDLTSGWQRAERVALAVGVLALMVLAAVLVVRFLG